MNNTVIAGVLHVSSPVILGYNKRKMPRKKFTGANKIKYSVATKMNIQDVDVYCVIRDAETKVEKVETDKVDKVDKVEDKVDKVNLNKAYKLGNIEYIIGNVGDYDAEYKYLKIKYNLKNFIFDLKIQDLHEDSRVNLNQENLIVSIDPPNCKDIDDAISIKIINDNIFELSVHIADVTSFIEEDSELDLLLKSRSTSCYLENNIINMMPENIIEEMSLLENKLRRAYSVTYVINNNEIINIKFSKTLIKLHKNYSYDEVNEIIINDVLLNKNNILINKISNFSKFLYETKFNFLDNSRKYDSHILVEMLMLLTNITVGEHLAKYDPENCILRKCINEIFVEKEETENNLITRVINNLKLKSAEYTLSTTLSRHNLLQQDYYTHFTSPIRRYADIIAHRQLYKSLNNINLNKININILNINSKISKQAERESKILNLIYVLYNNDNKVIIQDAYIININDNIIQVYVDEYKLILDCKLFSNKLKSIINYKVNNDSLCLNKLTLQVAQKIKIKIVISIKESKLRNKLLVIITEPNVMSYIEN
jgi:exoribonuclease R